MLRANIAAWPELPYQHSHVSTTDGPNLVATLFANYYVKVLVGHHYGTYSYSRATDVLELIKECHQVLYNHYSRLLK